MKAKAKAGQRQLEALRFIESAEKARRLWTVTELANELGVVQAQAGAIVNALVAKGRLVRAERTVVVEDALRLAGGAL